MSPLARGATLLVLSFLLTGAGYDKTLSKATIHSPGAVISAQDDAVNLSEAVLYISKEWNPTLNLGVYRAKLNALTQSISNRLTEGASPAETIRILREAIHTTSGYAYTDEVDGQGIPLNPNELFMHGLLDTRRGYCMNLSLLYLVVAERLNLPIFGVALPNHFFVRYQSKTARINIEATDGGHEFPDSFYRQRFDLPDSEEVGYFLSNLAKKQTLGAYYSNVGMAYYKKGKPAKAIYYLQASTKINPASLDSHNNLGNILAEEKRHAEAVEQYLLALKYNPGDLSTLYNLGATYMEMGDKKKAIEAFLQVVQIQPGYTPARAKLARLYIELKRYYPAIVHLKKLLEQDPRSLQTLTALADAYLKVKQPKLALEILKRAETQFPKNPAILGKMAEAYYRSGDYEQAIFAYRYLLEADPKNLATYVQLGWTYYRKGNLKMATAWTRRGLDQADESPKHKILAQMNLGFFNLLGKKFDAAERWYQQVFSEKNTAAYEGMLQDLSEARENYPRLNEINFFSGWIYLEKGDQKKAEESLNNYLEKSPNGALAGKARALLSDAPKKSPPQQAESDPKSSEPNNKKDKSGFEKMVKVPAGVFIMGSNDHGADEKPEHRVYLDAYYIDQYETNASDYAEFLNQTDQAKIYYLDAKSGVLVYDGRYRTQKGFENYPINNVSWFGAAAYCRWKNKRLPTEAEWEKAARGSEGNLYPWGSAPPDPEKARYFQTWTEENNLRVMVPVDELPKGQSPYGAFNMAGNVKEWVDDWHDREYYSEKDHQKNPTGSIGGEFKSMRGGSWHDLSGFIYSSYRNNNYPGSRMNDYGFRCAKSESPKAPGTTFINGPPGLPSKSPFKIFGPTIKIETTHAGHN